MLVLDCNKGCSNTVSTVPGINRYFLTLCLIILFVSVLQAFNWTTHSIDSYSIKCLSSHAEMLVSAVLSPVFPLVGTISFHKVTSHPLPLHNDASSILQY